MAQDTRITEPGESGEIREVPTCPFHLADAPVGEDRAVGWRMVRDAGDVVEIDGAVFLTSWAAVEEAGRHPEAFSSKRALRHLGEARCRSYRSRSIRPTTCATAGCSIRSSRPAAWRRWSRPCASRRGQSSTASSVGAGFDAIVDRAAPYPSQVFLTLFGLPLADREQLLAWKDGLLQAVDPTGGDPDPGAMDAALGLFEYVQRSVAERRHGDGNGPHDAAAPGDGGRGPDRRGRDRALVPVRPRGARHGDRGDRFRAL